MCPSNRLRRSGESVRLDPPRGRCYIDAVSLAQGWLVALFALAMALLGLAGEVVSGARSGAEEREDRGGDEPSLSCGRRPAASASPGAACVARVAPASPSPLAAAARAPRALRALPPDLAGRNGIGADLRR